MRTYLVNTTAIIRLGNGTEHAFPISIEVRCEPEDSQQEIFKAMKNASLGFRSYGKNDIEEIPEVLYRTEEYSGSGVRDIMEIIENEVCELGNADIPKYMLEHYAFPEELQSMLQTIKDQCEFGINPTREQTHKIFRVALDQIGSQRGMKITCGLWLAGRDEVEEHYLRGEDGKIDAYQTSPVILSDLGPEGYLFAYPEEPKKIQD